MAPVIEEPEIDALEQLPNKLELRRPECLDFVLRPRGADDCVHQLLITRLCKFDPERHEEKEVAWAEGGGHVTYK